MVDRRNYDFQDLSGRLMFFPPGLNENHPLLASFVDNTFNVYQSDVLFWMVCSPSSKHAIDTLAHTLLFRLGR